MVPRYSSASISPNTSDSSWSAFASADLTSETRLLWRARRTPEGHARRRLARGPARPVRRFANSAEGPYCHREHGSADVLAADAISAVFLAASIVLADDTAVSFAASTSVLSCLTEQIEDLLLASRSARGLERHRWHRSPGRGEWS
jgi:hypothetical protein